MRWPLRRFPCKRVAFHIGRVIRMSHDSESHLDALALVIDAVRDAPKLQSWFQELARMSNEKRQAAVLRAVQEMTRHRESEKLTAAIGLLAHPKIFAAAAAALGEPLV